LAFVAEKAVVPTEDSASMNSRWAASNELPPEVLMRFFFPVGDGEISIGIDVADVSGFEQPSRKAFSVSSERFQ